MSGLDQPIVIANSCYHTGHERSFWVAEEQGYLKEEGLEHYVYQRGGLIPGEWEFVALGRQMWERGVDIATAVEARAAVVQCARGQDVYIVGGWRVQPLPKLIGAKGITRPQELRGGKTILRERWGLNHISIMAALHHFGLGPNDVDWVEDSGVSYGAGEPDDLLRAGHLSFIEATGLRAHRLLNEGYPLVLDLADFYLQRGPWPPGKVIVATRQTIEQRGEDLRAFLRANLRGFWFSQDPRNHAYMYDLETRCRAATFNADERRVRRLRSIAEAPADEDPRQIGGSMAMDGLVPRPALAGVIDELVEQLAHSLEVDKVLEDAASIDACQQLLSRGLIQPERLDEWRRAKGIEPAVRS